jgi:hypothetical protein
VIALGAVELLHFLGEALHAEISFLSSSRRSTRQAALKARERISEITADALASKAPKKPKSRTRD